MIVETILIIALCIIFAGFFSGSETALISINRVKLRHLAEAGKPDAKKITELIKTPEKVLAMTLVGTNIAIVTASGLCTSLVNEAWLATLILTPLVLIFAEAIPKFIFRQRANELALRFAKPITFFYKLLYPCVYVILRISGQTKQTHKSPFVTREELKYLIREGERSGAIEPRERSIIHSIFNFGAKKVKEILVPLKNTAVIDAAADIKALKELVKQTGYSRIPVYEKTKDNIIGIVNILDTLVIEDITQKIKQIIRPCTLVSQETPIDNVLLILQSKKQPLGIITDVNKKPVGIVTIEDLVEEIVGEI